jgi:hypothetical protein
MQFLLLVGVLLILLSFVFEISYLSPMRVLSANQVGFDKSDAI